VQSTHDLSWDLHSVSVVCSLGKGALCMYPSFRVPTHPFRVLGFIARGSSRGRGGFILVLLIIRPYRGVMCPGAMFALVIRKIFHSGVPFNSLTAKCILVGTKAPSRKTFCQRNTHHTINIPTMMSHFPHLASWFPWTNITHSRDPLRKGLDEAASEGFSITI